MNIRYGNSSDAKILSEVGAKTFYDTFAKDNTPENMAAHLKNSFAPEIQLAELTDPNNIFLIIDNGDQPLGYAQVILNSKEEFITGTNPLEIRRIYATQENIGKGIGKELMQAAIREAQQRGCDSVWLGVWEKNPRVISFYTRWGFVEVGTHVFTVGDDPQRDLIMELMLV
jgi:diamine N-acetyltransferase